MDRIQMLLDYVRANPGDPFPRYGLAMEYKNRGRLDDAATAFAELVAHHPDYTAAYLHAGNTLVELGRRDEARRMYEVGIEACRRKGDAHALGEIEAALTACL
jgi:predicted Zn-dependent protease